MNSKPLLTRARLLTLSIVGLLSFGAMRLLAQESQDPGYQDQGDQDQGQQQPPGGDIDYNGDPQQDPPSRVARLSYIDGSVSFQPGGQGDWGAATRNRPVTIGDKIWSDNNSKAELQAGQASVHISSMTALSFLNLDDQTTQMRLAEGTINFRVREMREGDVYEVDTPNLAFTVTQAGAFRVEVNENGDGTRVTVIRGEGQVVANDQTYTIRAGERGEFNGVDNVSYFVASAPAPDDFDRWSDARDRRDDDSISAKYVSRDVPGYSDLDDNGTWNEEPDYGPVWYPNVVDAGWAPYSYGYWNYIGPWGWTWVDYSPWGFAPYHYGRWAFIGNRWGWCPGSYYSRPIYGPAFVGFLGGSHWSLGFSFGGGWGGGIGWFPLGPRECFRPWYRTSNAYYRNVNIHNTFIRNTNVFNGRGNFNYAYARNARAVTVASRSNFVGGHAINRGSIRVNDAALRGAQVTNRVNFQPTRQSYMGANAFRGNVSRPSAAVQNRYVVARTTPGARAGNMPVRTFGNGSNSFGRGGLNNDRPAMGRAAQMNAAANSNRSSVANGTHGNRGNGNGPNNGGSRPDLNRPNFGSNNGTQNRGQINAGRGGFANNQAGMTARQRELAQDKPQTHMRTTPDSGNGRSWSAQGNTTDRGRAPSGFASDARNNPPRNDSRASSPNSSPNRGSFDNGSRNSNMIRGDRPAWANGSNGNSGNRADGNNRSNSPPQRGSGGYASDRPNNSNGNNRSYNTPPRGSGGFSSDRPANNSNGGGRSYNPPQRSSGGVHDRPSSYNMGGNRGYSQPNYGNRSYSQPNFAGRGSQPSFGSRGSSQPRYPAPSAPSRSYSAPSAPSRSFGGGGGRPSGGGGGVPRSSGGGGGPRGGGGGSPRGGGSSHGRH
jgi:FecR protein